MADLSVEAIARIAAARRQAEAQLERALAAVAASEDVAPYLSSFRAFACNLENAEASELLLICEAPAQFGAKLDETDHRITEDIFPNRGLWRIRPDPSNERPSTEYDIGTGLLWEVGPDGARRPAGAETQSVHGSLGDWERFAPPSVRFSLRGPKDNATVRLSITQALQQNRGYWVDRFYSRVTATSQPESASQDARQADAVPVNTGSDTQSAVPTAQPLTMAIISPRDRITLLAVRRCLIVEPMLKEKGFTRSKWATKAGVNPSVVYDYLSGKSTPRPENKNALADAIGVPAACLPD